MLQQTPTQGADLIAQLGGPLDDERAPQPGEQGRDPVEVLRAPWGNRSVLLRDPDGNLVNLFAPVGP